MALERIGPSAFGHKPPVGIAVEFSGKRPLTRRPAPGESPARSPGFVFSATAREALDDAWPSVASHNSEHNARRPGFQAGHQRFTQARRIGAKPNAAPSQAELRLTCQRHYRVRQSIHNGEDNP